MSVSDLTSLIKQFLPEPHAGLLSGILFGTKEAISWDLRNALINSGTLHIVALSGVNIMILITIIGWILKLAMNRRLASLFTIIFIIGFVWFVGPSASVIRAAIMGSITLIGIVWGRQVWAVWSLIITACSMLLFKPDFLFDVGFQLSLAASFGLILFARTDLPLPAQAGFKGSLLNFIYMELRTTLSAQVFTIPIILLQFGQISFISPLSNLLIGWILTPLTVAGLIMVITGLLYSPLGQVTAWFCYLMLEYVVSVVRLTGSVPGSSFRF